MGPVGRLCNCLLPRVRVFSFSLYRASFCVSSICLPGMLISLSQNKNLLQLNCEYSFLSVICTALGSLPLQDFGEVS